MAIYWPTPSFKGRTFKLCVLTRWDFNFCVRSSLLRGSKRSMYVYILTYSRLAVTVSSWAYPILSSNLSKKFKTLLQDSSSWHLVIITLHLSWKSCTGFPFQSTLNTKLHAYASMLWMDLVILTSLNSYISTLRLACFALLQVQACSKSNNTNSRLMAFALSLTLDPMFGIHSHRTSDTAQLFHLLKQNWKLSFFSRCFHSSSFQ